MMAQEEFGPGDVVYLPPGHNAWIIGNEPCVAIDPRYEGICEEAID